MVTAGLHGPMGWPVSVADTCTATTVSGVRFGIVVLPEGVDGKLTHVFSPSVLKRQLMAELKEKEEA